MSQYNNESGLRTFTSGSTLARYLRVKTPSAVVVAGATDRDLGVVMTAVNTSGDPANVCLPSAPGTVPMTADGAITAGAQVYGAASGKVSATANQNPIGMALTAASTDGDIIEVLRGDFEVAGVVGGTSLLTVSNGDGTTDLAPENQYQGTTKAKASLLLASFNTTNDNTVGPTLAFLKSGHGTIGSNTVVASGENLGEMLWFGADGTDFESPAAAVRCEVDNTPGAGDMPGRLVFLTTADGGETLTEALRITSTQDVRINNGGGLIVGDTSAQITISDGDGSTNLIPEVQILGTGKADGSLLLMVNSATATSAAAPSVNLVKSAHATLGSNTIVVSGEVLGEVNFFGADGTDFESCAASIRGLVDGTPGVGDMPGRIAFYTSADNAETPLEKARIAGAAATALLTVGVAGTSTGSLLLSGATSGTLKFSPAAAAGTIEFIFPSAVGTNGEQLTTNGNAGSATLSWAAAGSLREFKNVLANISSKAQEALDRIMNRDVYEFTYRNADGAVTTRDFDTHYRGVLGDEYPEVMHHNGRIFNPVSAFGEAMLAIKALAQKISGLEASLAK